MVSQVNRRAGQGQRVVQCKVGGARYALDLEGVRGFQRTDRLRRRSGNPLVAGFLPAANGEVIVYSLAALLGQPRPTDEQAQHIVLVSTSAGLCGLLMEHVSQVLDVQAGSAQPLPPLLAAWPEIPARQLLRVGDELLLLLVPERLHPETIPSDSIEEELPSRPGGEVPAPVALAGRGATGQKQMVLFKTADPSPRERALAFGLSQSQVHEIIECEWPTLLSVPHAPDFLLGLVDWRSVAVPVLDLGLWLGLSPARVDRRSRLIIAHAAEAGWVALLARPSIRVVPLSLPHQPCRRVLPLDSSRVYGAVELKQETVVIPRLNRLLHAAE
jgi:chemotaxis signal transduction protein